MLGFVLFSDGLLWTISSSEFSHTSISLRTPDPIQGIHRKIFSYTQMNFSKEKKDFFVKKNKTDKIGLN